MTTSSQSPRSLGSDLFTTKVFRILVIAFLLGIFGVMMSDVALAQNDSRSQPPVFKADVGAVIQALTGKINRMGEFTAARYDRLAEALEQAQEDDAGKQLLKNAQDFAKGKIEEELFVTYLEGKLKTTGQRTTQVASDAVGQKGDDRQKQVDRLWTTAQANDSPANGKMAIAALDELLQLDPSHTMARSLRDKISLYFADPATPSVARGWIASVDMQRIYDSYHKTPAGLKLGAIADSSTSAESVRQRTQLVEEIKQRIAHELHNASFTLVLDTSGNTLNGLPVVVGVTRVADVTDELINIVNGNSQPIKSAGTGSIAIAIIDLNQAFLGYYKTPIDSAKLKATADEFNKEYEVMRTGYQKSIEELNRLRSENSPRVSSQLTETQRLQREMEEYKESHRQLLDQQTQRMRKEILNEINEVVMHEARSMGYVLVLDVSGNTLNTAPVVSHAAGVFNMTETILAVLNGKTRPASLTSVLEKSQVAIIDLNQAFLGYYKTPIDSAKLKATADEFNKEYEVMRTGYQKSIEELNRLRSENSPRVSSQLTETQRLQREMEEYKESHRQLLDQQTQRMRKEILNEINEVLQHKSRQLGYSLVLDRSGNTMNGLPAVIDASGAKDITEQLIQALNDSVR